MKPKILPLHQLPPAALQRNSLPILVALIITSIGLSACGGGSSGGGEVSAPPQIVIMDVSATKTMRVSWSMPDLRENGEVLYPYEIGGYEILYKKLDDTLYTSEIVADSQTLSLEIGHLTAGDYEVYISCFDTNSQFSEYQLTSTSID